MQFNKHTHTDTHQGKKRTERQDSVGFSADVDPDDQYKIYEVEREAQCAQGLHKNCRHSVFTLSLLIRGFRNKNN